MELKECFVTGCSITSKDSTKWFVPVPKELTRRLAWFSSAQRKFISGECNVKPYYCCCDHFNVKEDTETCVDASGNLRTRLKHSVLPRPIIKVLIPPEKTKEVSPKQTKSSVESVGGLKVLVSSKGDKTSNDSGKEDEAVKNAFKLSNQVKLIRKPSQSTEGSKETDQIKQSTDQEGNVKKEIYTPPKEKTGQLLSAEKTPEIHVVTVPPPKESFTSNTSLQSIGSDERDAVDNLDNSTNKKNPDVLSTEVQSVYFSSVQVSIPSPEGMDPSIPFPISITPAPNETLTNRSSVSNDEALVRPLQQKSPPISVLRVGVLPQPPVHKEPATNEASNSLYSLTSEEEREKRLEALYSSAALTVPSLTDKVGLSRVQILDEIICYVEQMRAKVHLRKAERGYLAATTYQLKQKILEVEMLKERLEKGDIVMSKDEFRQRFNLTDPQLLNRPPQRKKKRKKRSLAAQLNK